MNILKLIAYLAGGIIGYLYGGIIGAIIGLTIASIIVWIGTSSNVSLTQPMISSNKKNKEEVLLKKENDKFGRLIMLGIFGFGLGVAFIFWGGSTIAMIYSGGEGIKQQYLGASATHWNPGEKTIAPAGTKSNAVYFDGRGEGYNPQGPVEIYYYAKSPHKEVLLGKDDAGKNQWKTLKKGFYRFKSTSAQDVTVYLN